MARKFSKLREKMSPEARAASEREFRQMVVEMPLRRLRAARELTQENLASVLRVKQSEVSKIERRTDMYLSTLASYVKAMGGTLEIRAAFPNGEVVKINQFESLVEPPAAKPTKKARATKNARER
jgi:transcriptional regulator with XRE-family HTH domain